ncbi:MAG TPA: TonB family protein [Candidatus Dormibacteraeota bacterium]|nr:TonB family protein [Candidatus Dormibacteraeota bacterium]
MPSDKNQGVFGETLLPEGGKRWSSFGAGLGLECLALALLIVIPLLMPQRFEIATHDWVTPISVPLIHPWKPQPRPKPKIVPVKREIVKEVIKPAVLIEKPKLYSPVMTKPIAKFTRRKMDDPAPEIAKALPSVSMGSSALPKLRVPVQTGGFGDPNGVPDNHQQNRNPNIAQLGAFDMPAGPGVGNGSGGKHGARGTIASAGFGNGIAVGGSGGPHGAVQQGAFSNQQASSAPKMRKTSVEENTNPVVILSVPHPVYTAEGRAHRVQGVVLLQVVFTANGEVRVERVVRGLGFGLDQAAEDAARQIRFRPATRDGRPVDFNAIARIEFELAY